MLTVCFPVGNMEAFEARIQKMSAAKELAGELAAARKLKTGKSTHYYYMMMDAQPCSNWKLFDVIIIL